MNRIGAVEALKVHGHPLRVARPAREQAVDRASALLIRGAQCSDHHGRCVVWRVSGRVAEERGEGEGQRSAVENQFEQAVQLLGRHKAGDGERCVA